MDRISDIDPGLCSDLIQHIYMSIEIQRLSAI